MVYLIEQSLLITVARPLLRRSVTVVVGVLNSVHKHANEVVKLHGARIDCMKLSQERWERSIVQQNRMNSEKPELITPYDGCIRLVDRPL